MSTTSVGQGTGDDLERTQQNHPGPDLTHHGDFTSNNFASSSFISPSTNEAQRPNDRPTTAINVATQPPLSEPTTSLDESTTESSSSGPQTPTPSSFLRQLSRQKSKLQPSSSSKPDPSGPVLVNPGPSDTSPSSSRSKAMQIPLSPHTLGGSYRRPNAKSKSIPRPPSPGSFSFTSILSSLNSDPTTQSDIDAIAEICSRSRLSMANEYTAHREPVGPGLGDGVQIGEDRAEAGEDEGFEQGHYHLPTLDTTYRATELETVDEAPTPLSEGSRSHQIGDTYNSNTANPSRSPTASAASDAEAAMSRWGFLDVWERGAALGQGRGASRSVLGLSGMEVEAIGKAESYASGAHGRNTDLREDISGAGGSRAVRQLMRVAGG